MRDNANKHRHYVHFKVGDKVLLKLQQYRQHSVAKPLSAKLARRYYGPFVVTEKIVQVAYQLQLPHGSQIHDVFHVSLLRPFVEGASSDVNVDFPREFVGSRSAVCPVSILDSRTALTNGNPIEQVLVKWADEEEAVATWEPRDVIARHFPKLLEGKEVLNGGGVDMDTTVHQPDGALELTDEPPEDSSEEEGTTREEPRRSSWQSKKPDWFKDFVSR